MLERMWEVLKGRRNTIEEARGDCLQMLATGREMFLTVLRAMKEPTSLQIREKVAAMDKSINREQQEVRKKIFEHLALSRSSDLLPGLQLLIIVVDLERIGDYGKNMAELADMLPEGMTFGEYEERYHRIEKGTMELFDLTRDALRGEDESRAGEVLEKYAEISKLCDGTLREVLTEGGMDACVEKWKLGLVLLLRYQKRLAGHLKNVATAIINPFHRIGYRT